MKGKREKFVKGRVSEGSALILAVVLTSLLAIVGVLFVMTARVERISTSAISENRELNLAIETVIANISQELTSDVPHAGVLPFINEEEYYDYPYHAVEVGLDGILGTEDDSAATPGPDQAYGTDDDVPHSLMSADAWLAGLEPGIVDYLETPAVSVDDDVGFRHITDLYGRLAILYHQSYLAGQTDSDSDRISFRNMRVRIVRPGERIENEGDKADADGDGVADSRWIMLPDMTSSKGRPIFAAVRVIDNGGMLNVNTGFKFDPNQIDIKSDGSSQMQINLMALASLPGEPPPTPAQQTARQTDLLEARANYGLGLDPLNLQEYEENVIWRYNEPNGIYTPFDISDELEFRYRFLLNQTGIDTRLEELGTLGGKWGFRQNAFWTPVDPGEEGEWFVSACATGGLDPNYAYRHIATTCNMDRIIAPGGVKMLNVNRIYDQNDLGLLYQAIQLGLADAGVTDDALAAQTAVNLVDYHDADSEVTAFDVDSDGTNDYFGFEQPCVYISELAHNFTTVDSNEEGVFNRSYAIELYKPYPEDDNPVNWGLVINWGQPGEIKKTIDWSGDSQFQVMRWIDENAPLVVDFNDPNDPDPNDPNDPNSTDPNLNRFVNPLNEIIFAAMDTITLHRPVPGGPDANVVVDSHLVPFGEPASGWLQPGEGSRSIERDIKPHRCIMRLWADAADAGSPTLGRTNPFEYLADANMIQAHPANRAFTNIGEVGAIFRNPAYYEMGPPTLPPPIGYGPNADSEAKVRVDLANRGFQQILNHLTVFDPSSDWINNDGDRLPDGTEIIDEWDELKVPGRININTAPWYVIAQLPWMQYTAGGNSYNRAQDVVIDRDLNGPYRSIGEVMRVPAMQDLALDVSDNLNSDVVTPGPDFTDDSALNDFEERDSVFARISNLVTVRSDVFTAYILVRIGTDGPQKRAIAILDRSDVYPDGTGRAIGKVKVRALHPVHDPR